MQLDKGVLSIDPINQKERKKNRQRQRQRDIERENKKKEKERERERERHGLSWNRIWTAGAFTWDTAE